jgi:predicted SnoaL-like aldol condensation-catalyzing enzyme
MALGAVGDGMVFADLTRRSVHNRAVAFPTPQPLGEDPMKPARLAVACALVLVTASAAFAQVPVTPTADQEAQLASPDPKLAANKRLVFDFWREVFEGGHMDKAEKYMAESYIQHNPNVATGRAPFIEFFSRIRKPKPIEPRITAPLVSITAERDLVTLAFAREYTDPKDPTRKYTTTWFDMFRIENGKIAEHWDPALKQ